MSVTALYLGIAAIYLRELWPRKQQEARQKQSNSEPNFEHLFSIEPLCRLMPLRGAKVKAEAQPETLSSEVRRIWKKHVGQVRSELLLIAVSVCTLQLTVLVTRFLAFLSQDDGSTAMLARKTLQIGSVSSLFWYVQLNSEATAK